MHPFVEFCDKSCIGCLFRERVSRNIYICHLKANRQAPINSDQCCNLSFKYCYQVWDYILPIVSLIVVAISELSGGLFGRSYNKGHKMSLVIVTCSNSGVPDVWNSHGRSGHLRLSW